MTTEYKNYPYPGGWDLIPPHMHGAVYRYVMHGIPPGGFLTSLLRDDPFSEVAGRADSTNLHQLENWAKFLCNYVPAAARRSGLAWWIERGGLYGISGGEEDE